MLTSTLCCETKELSVPAKPVGRATVLPGAVRFSFNDNVNPTYRGRIVVADDEVRMGFIKDLDAKQLANELLAATLAREAGLPVPEPFLGLVSNGDLPIAHAPPTTDGNAHYVFVSVDVETPALWQQYDPADVTAYEEACHRLSKWPLVGKFYGFDSWVANIDRHQGNILFSSSDIYLIDHGHVFSGPKWSNSTLIPAQIYTNKIKDWLTPYIPDSAKADCLSEGMGASYDDTDFVGEMCAGSFALDFLDSSEGGSLVDFLCNRAKALEPIIQDALCMPSGTI